MTSREQFNEMQSDQEEILTSSDHRLPLHNNITASMVRDARDYKDLLDAYIALKSSYNTVVGKQKHSLQTINKLKKELQTCKRRLAGKHCPRQKSAGKSVGKDAKDQIDNETQLMNDCTQTILLERLTDAERQLKSLSEITNHSSNGKENIDLRRKLDETTTELNILKSKQEFQENKIESQCSKLEQILMLHGEYKSKYDRLKRELRFSENENVQLKELLKEFTEQNTFLEGQVAQLCEAPAESHVEKQISNERIHQIQTDFDDMKLQYDRLKKEHEKLRLELGQHHKSTTESTPHPLQQQLDLTENELENTKRLLALQVSINDAIQNERKEVAAAHSNELKEYNDLLEKSNEYLQKIRLLEGLLEAKSSNSRLDQHQSDALSHSLERDENILEVHIARGMLECDDFSDQTCSFILVDFHTFGSVLSPIVKGVRPEYGLRAIYKLTQDNLALAIARGLRIELYTIQHDNAVLVASSLLSCQKDEDFSSYLPRVIGWNELNLCRHGDDASIGTLNVSLTLAQPLFPKTLVGDGYQRCFGFQSVSHSGIEITIDRLALKHENSNPNHSFFVHYSLCGNRFTEVQTCNENEDVVFQHNEVFPVISSNEYIQKDIGNIFRHHLSLVVFRDNGDSSESTFNAIGEAQVELGELIQKNEIYAKVVSRQANVIGDLHLLGRKITRK